MSKFWCYKHGEYHTAIVSPECDLEGNTAAPAPSAAPSQAGIEQMPKVVKSAHPAETMWRCACGVLNDADRKSCRACGEPVQTPPVAHASAEVIRKLREAYMNHLQLTPAVLGEYLLDAINALACLTAPVGQEGTIRRLVRNLRKVCRTDGGPVLISSEHLHLLLNAIEQPSPQAGAGPQDYRAIAEKLAKLAKHHHMCAWTRPMPTGEGFWPCDCGLDQFVLDGELIAQPSGEAEALIAEIEKAANAIYIAVEAPVADSISGLLKRAAAALRGDR